MRILLLSMPDMVPQLKMWQAPNLALSSITGNMKGHEVYMADLILVRNRLRGALEGLLKEYKPHLVGLSAMSFQFHTARRIASFVKELDEDIKTVLGGYHATLMYDEIASSGEAKPFDFILRGESDLSFSELLQAVEGKAKYEDIKGLSFRQNGQFVHNPPRPLEDLSTIAPPNRTNRYGWVIPLVTSPWILSRPPEAVPCPATFAVRTICTAEPLEPMPSKGLLVISLMQKTGGKIYSYC